MRDRPGNNAEIGAWALAGGAMSTGTSSCDAPSKIRVNRSDQCYTSRDISKRLAMLRALLVTVLSVAAFGDTITYNYTGNTFSVCDGLTSVNQNCPANSFINFNLASLTFNAPLAANLSAANEAASQNLTAWTMRDALGDTPPFSSTDANAASELTALALSTNGSGAITGWTMTTQTSGFTFSPYLAGGAYYGINNPTFIGGSGFLNADDLVFGGNGGDRNVPGGGYNLSNGLTGTWTETLNGFQGGSTSAPVFLLGGSPVAGVTGSIGGPDAEEYYGFYWGGGAFSASADVTGAAAGASYLFTEGNASSSCSGGASETLNSADSFANTIAIANLAPGQYCIGLDANSLLDPTFALTFNTPVTGTPEPSSLVPLLIALGMIGLLRRAKLRMS
jgi:hypothetical protein